MIPGHSAETTHRPIGDLPSETISSGRGYKLWPLVLLALLTIIGSGIVSYVVANETSVAGTADAADSGTTDGTESGVINGGAIEPVVSTVDPGSIEASPAASSLSDEPFAFAASKIEPSVVQLTLIDGLGSGVIINRNGTILTAAHVVGANDEVQVRLSDGSIVDGEVLGAHEPTDVAVVKIDPTGRDLVAAPIAEVDEIRVGQLAVAVGSPFGFEQTVTAGIISGVDRVINQVSMVQTDAPINPGNSGGPLINLEGEVVGINDLIFTQSGTSAGVGFAISIDLAVLVADQIIAGQPVQLALLGVETGQDPEGRPGALVLNVVSGSAADDAGILTGDLLVGIDGRSTTGGAQLRAQVIGSPPGTTISLDVIREGQRTEVMATLGSTG